MGKFSYKPNYLPTKTIRNHHPILMYKVEEVKYQNENILQTVPHLFENDFLFCYVLKYWMDMTFMLNMPFMIDMTIMP
jgi:hypothetical protein